MLKGDHATESISWGRAIISLVVMALLVLGMSWCIRTFVFCPYQIPSGSMTDTIEIGDMIFSEKVTYYFNDVQQGDIVTFDEPLPTGEEARTLIKRVIAVGGQTVNLNADGTVSVDGAVLDEPYVDGKPTVALTPATGLDITYPYTVPEGYIWVMGDNRTNSKDSRYFGAIPVSSVSGRAALIYWPLNHFVVF